MGDDEAARNGQGRCHGRDKARGRRRCSDDSSAEAGGASANGTPEAGLCDVWSMGVVLFRMACGRLPFHAASLRGLRRAVASWACTVARAEAAERAQRRVSAASADGGGRSRRRSSCAANSLAAIAPSAMVAEAEAKVKAAEAVAVATAAAATTSVLTEAEVGVPASSSCRALGHGLPRVPSGVCVGALSNGSGGSGGGGGGSGALRRVPSGLSTASGGSGGGSTGGSGGGGSGGLG